MLGLAAYKAGRAAEARNHYQRLLADRTTPPGINERARIMMVLLNEPEPVKTAPPAPEKTESPAKPEPSKDNKAKATDKKAN